MANETLDDVYWILRLAVGVALEERIDFYRQRLLRLGVEPLKVEQRIAGLRPFLIEVFGRAGERSDGARGR